MPTPPKYNSTLEKHQAGTLKIELYDGFEACIKVNNTQPPIQPRNTYQLPPSKIRSTLEVQYEGQNLGGIYKGIEYDTVIKLKDDNGNLVPLGWDDVDIIMKGPTATHTKITTVNDASGILYGKLEALTAEGDKLYIYASVKSSSTVFGTAVKVARLPVIDEAASSFEIIPGADGHIHIGETYEFQVALIDTNGFPALLPNGINDVSFSFTGIKADPIIHPEGAMHGSIKGEITPRRWGSMLAVVTVKPYGIYVGDLSTMAIVAN